MPWTESKASVSVTLPVTVEPHIYARDSNTCTGSKADPDLAVEGPFAYDHPDLGWVAFLDKCCSRGGRLLTMSIETRQHMACYHCWPMLSWG